MAKPTKRFIILIGGPGLYAGCDKEHDKTWSNYIVPMQVAAQKGYCQKLPNEAVYWVVYEPPYRNRWRDDSVITPEERKQDDGYNLHSVRKAAADKIIKKGAADYIGRIKQFAAQYKFTYIGINAPAQFWDFIAKCPPGSISRVWYCGHASPDGLMLALIHDNACKPQAYKTDMIMTIDLMDTRFRARSLVNRFDSNTTKPSKFYGCYTATFAKVWHNLFRVPTQGAVNKITFGCIDSPSDIPNVLIRLEQTPTSFGSPQWSNYP